MVSYTPNYGFALPGVGDPTDQDLWGGYLNDNFDELDTLIKANSLGEVDAAFTTNYTITTDDNNKLLLFDTTSGNLTVTVPAASGFDNGFTVTIKKIASANSLNFLGTIDGISNPTIEDENKAVTITSNGSVWYFKADFIPFGAGPAETVVQKKIVQNTTGVTLSSTSYSTTGISFSLDGALASASNKVRITVYGYAGVGSNLGNSLYFTIKTGSTDLAPVGCTGLAGVMCDTPNGPTEQRGLDTFTMFVERTPGTTTPETYTIYARAAYTATNFYINRSADNSEKLPTTIIIEEVQVN